MATGLPIVATRSVGVVDCLTDGRDALLVEPGDVDGLAAALARVLEDRALRGRLAAAALAEVRAKYAWPIVAGLVQDVYERVLRQPAANGWAMPAGRPPCRFRAAPHLL
jgi:glycosyltransferase involved in cell wall biosynthesis